MCQSGHTHTRKHRELERGSVGWRWWLLLWEQPSLMDVRKRRIFRLFSCYGFGGANVYACVSAWAGWGWLIGEWWRTGKLKAFCCFPVSRSQNYKKEKKGSWGIYERRALGWLHMMFLLVRQNSWPNDCDCAFIKHRWFERLCERVLYRKRSSKETR